MMRVFQEKDVKERTKRNDIKSIVNSEYERINSKSAEVAVSKMAEQVISKA